MCDDENFEYAGDCIVCNGPISLDDLATCTQCGNTFHIDKCGELNVEDGIFHIDKCEEWNADDDPICRHCLNNETAVFI